MSYDRFDERHSFNVLGFIQLLYDTTCVNSDFWVKPVWGLGCNVLMSDLVSIIMPSAAQPQSPVMLISCFVV